MPFGSYKTSVDSLSTEHGGGTPTCDHNTKRQHHNNIK